MTNVVIGLCAYNEEQAIAKILDKLLQLKQNTTLSLQIVVINDGSTDKTKEILTVYENTFSFIHVIDHEENKGLGAALNTLFNAVLTTYDKSDILVTLDADNTHNPLLIPSIIAKLTSEKLDIVIASRFTSGGKELGLSQLRKFYSRGAMLFTKIFFPIPNVHDYSSGYRAYRIEVLQKAHHLYNGKIVTSNGFEAMVEVLARLGKIGVKAGEYPLVLEYHLKETPSKMNIPKTINGYFQLLIKIKKPPQYLK